MAQNDISGLTISKNGPSASKPRRIRPVLAVAVMTALLVAGLWISGVLSPAAEVETSLIGATYPSQAVTLLNASGYVVAQRRAAVASKITGRLEKINVEEGMRVVRGSVVAELEHEDLRVARDQAAEALGVSQASLAEARAELRNSEAEQKRAKELADRGYISKSEFDSTDTRLRKAQAAVAGAEAALKRDRTALTAAGVALEYAVIRAPFDAVVLTKNADVGDIITPLGAAANAKAAVVTIADMGSLQIEVDVSESNLGKIKIGQPCEIQLDALPDLRFRGEVHMIVPTADRTKAAVMIKVKFLDKDPRILPEMSAKVAFLERPLGPDEMKPFVAIDPSAIKKTGEASFVYVVKDNRAVETRITTGRTLGGLVEITSGLSAGDRIILRPGNRVRNNTKVRLKQQ